MIDKQEEINFFTAYPNPASNEVRFVLPDEISSETFYIRIYDMQGKVSYFADIKAKDNIIEVNISSFVTGLYFAEIVVKETGKMWSTKLSVIR